MISWETTSKFRNDLQETNQSLYKQTFEAFADYSHTWNKVHNFKIVGGMQYDTRYYRKNAI